AVDILEPIWRLSLPPDTGITVTRCGQVYTVTKVSRLIDPSGATIKLTAEEWPIEDYKFLTDLFAFELGGLPNGLMYVQLGESDQVYVVQGYQVIKFPEGCHVAFYVDLDRIDQERFRHKSTIIRATENEQLHNDIHNMLYGAGR